MMLFYVFVCKKCGNVIPLGESANVAGMKCTCGSMEFTFYNDGYVSVMHSIAEGYQAILHYNDNTVQVRLDR